jgi:AAA ATPase domain
MKLIKSVEVERFRSCERTTVEDLTDIAALTGLNNAGKSNVLRALNLFFNGETDPDSALLFESDFRLCQPSKKKKSISVTVEFNVPSIFGFRKGLEQVRDLVGKHFWIRKTWTLDSVEPQIELRLDADQTFKRVGGEQQERALQFLSLISFRYIPNRAVPAEVVREQSRGVIQQLAPRLLTKGAANVAPLLKDMTAVAQEMVQTIASDMARACEGLSGLELATPATVADLLGAAGFRAAIGTFGQVQDTSLGSGVQSLLMFHVLHMIDQGQIAQGFGWRQATIWAVEEPESSLHRQLQFRLAALLRGYSIGEETRFQILMTTHNDVFTFGGTSGYLVTLSNDLATVCESRPLFDLAKEVESRQITTLPGSALQYPFDALVIVEGDCDARVLTHVAQMANVGGVKFLTPSQLDQSLTGDGLDNVRQLIQRHARAFPQRLSGHPLLVLVDWEVPQTQVNSMRAKYGDNGVTNVRGMDAAWADNLVGVTFKGMNGSTRRPSSMRQKVAERFRSPGGRMVRWSSLPRISMRRKPP